MGVIVQFDYGAWSAAYPELASYISQSQAQEYFTIATSIHRNDGGGPVEDSTQQLNLLNMLTAHIAYLFAPPAAGQPVNNNLVGRISSASQGSVSVQAAYSNNVGQQMAWFVQTKYGAMYWAAAAPYRTMRYMPSRCRRGVVGGRGFGV